MILIETMQHRIEGNLKLVLGSKLQKAHVIKKKKLKFITVFTNKTQQLQEVVAFRLRR